MATYGKGYFSDMSTLTIGIEEGLAEAFRLTCEQLLDDIRSWTDADIYSQPESDRYTPSIPSITNLCQDGRTYCGKLCLHFILF